MNKRRASVGLVVLSWVVCWVLVSSAQAAEKLTKVAENVYAYVDTKQGSKDNSFGANTGVIIGRDGIVVVDTLISAKEAKRFIKDIRALSKKPIKYVINTHYHLDHVFGNSEFAKLGAVIIAQENDKQAMLRSAETALKNAANYGLTPEDMQGTKVAHPVLSFGDRMSIDLGDQVVELLHVGHAHTDGDTLVVLPGKKLLFTGDLLFTNYHPFLAEGDIESWCAELDKIQGMEVETIIPGHGPVSSKKDVAEMKQYLMQFDHQASVLAAQETDLEKMTAAMLQTLPQRAEGAWLVGANLKMKYLGK